VSAHGAALSNIVFCPAGATIVEIFSPRYVNVCFLHIASSCQLNYYYLLGEGKKIAEGEDPGGVCHDILVSVSKFDSFMRNC
jgi:capsular polysaccharide biosynthesis protein